MKNKRSEFIDYIRGTCLVAVFFNHLGLFFPATVPLLKTFYEPLGYFSYAEVFLMISAYALIQSSYNSNQKLHSKNVLVDKAKRRFLHLYKAHVVILSVVVFLSLFSNWYFRGSKEIGTYNPLKSYVLGLLLLFQPQLFDILPVYMIMSLLNPIILISLQKNKHLMLIIVSSLLWLAAQIYNLPNKLLYPYGIVLPYFNLLGWQFLYLLLVILFLLSEQLKLNQKSILAISLIICSSLLVIHHQYIRMDYFPYFLVSRQNMGPLRLLNTLSFAYLCITIKPFLTPFLINSKIKDIMLLKLFAWAGRHSLYIFSLHVIVYHINKLFLQLWTRRQSNLYQLIICFSLVLAPLIIEYARQKMFHKINKN